MRGPRHGRPTIDEMIARNLPPRERLESLVGKHGESLAALSRMVRRDDGYLQRYVRRGVPSRLRPDESRLLGLYFDVPPAEIGG